jgi:hypothetical protein
VERIGTRHFTSKSWHGNLSQTVAVLELNDRRAPCRDPLHGAVVAVANQ